MFVFHGEYFISMMACLMCLAVTLGNNGTLSFVIDVIELPTLDDDDDVDDDEDSVVVEV